MEALTSPVLIARTAEAARLHAIIDATADGAPGLAIVSGEAGVGKTRLVDAAIDHATRRGLQVVIGHCVQLGTEGLAYAPLVEALRPLTRGDGDELDTVLGPARDLVMRLTNGGGADGDPLAGSQVLELVLGLVERLAAIRPLLIVLEDLHWGDRSTLELAAFLGQNLRGIPAALLLTYRTDEVDRRHPLRALQSAWERNRVGTRLELARFDRDEVRTLLAAILGAEPDPDTLDVVFERSEGNAFLAEEIFGAVRAGDPRGLPPSLKDILLARLDGLAPVTEELLRLAAIAGRAVPERLLVAASGRDEGEVLAAIRGAVEAHLLVIDDAGHGYRFRHALARDAVVDDLLPGERVRLHARFAEVLAADPELLAGTRLSTAATLAHHAYAALDLPTALTASIAAGREASAQLAPHDAVGQFERALQVWPRVPVEALPDGIDQAEVLRLAAVAAAGAGDIDRALSFIEQGTAELPIDADPARRAEFALVRNVQLLSLGRARDSVELLTATLDDLPPGPTPIRAEVEAALATALMRRIEPERSAAHARAAAASAHATGALRVEADALTTLGSSLGLQGDPAGINHVRAGVERAVASGHAYTILRSWINLSDLLETWGRSAESIAAAEAGLAAAERYGMLRTFGTYAIGNLAESLVRTGEWARARELIDASLRRLPEGVFEASAQIVRAELA
ncbi:MAG: AAA family ATPase, partial [Microbacteriaceae bacterium]|nr:AAA family ATPase [Microbacteriaceae bacterium]